MFAFISTGPLLLIGLVTLLLFGRRLPEVMRSMGQGVKEFQDGIREAGNEDKRSVDSPSSESQPH